MIHTFDALILEVGKYDYIIVEGARESGKTTIAREIWKHGYEYYCTWRNRKSGVSKFKIKDMSLRYLFILCYCLLEKWSTFGEYKKNA